MFPIFTPVSMPFPGMWRGLGFLMVSSQDCPSGYTVLPPWKEIKAVIWRKCYFSPFFKKKKVDRRGGGKEKYSNCVLWLLGVCWGKLGRKVFGRISWRVLQLKSVICLKNGKRITKGKCLLLFPSIERQHWWEEGIGLTCFYFSFA